MKKPITFEDVQAAIVRGYCSIAEGEDENVDGDMQLITPHQLQAIADEVMQLIEKKNE